MLRREQGLIFALAGPTPLQAWRLTFPCGVGPAPAFRQKKSRTFECCHRILVTTLNDEKPALGLVQPGPRTRTSKFAKPKRRLALVGPHDQILVYSPNIRRMRSDIMAVGVFTCRLRETQRRSWRTSRFPRRQSSETNQIVVFLKALTDGCKPAKYRLCALT